MKKSGFLATLILALPLLAGCDGGKGGVELDTWGEEYIEVGIPAAEFEDGWDITFTKFLIHLGHVTVADAEGNVGAKMEGTILFELEGEAPRNIAAGEAFWEPGGDVVHYQVANLDPHHRAVFLAVCICAPGVDMITMLGPDEIQARDHLRHPDARQINIG